MKTKIKTKAIVSLISLSFLMLIISALPAKAMANPASEYCVGVGGTLEIRAQEDGGQYGVCLFTDGSECEEWALYNGECQKGLIQEEIKEKNIQNQEAIAKLRKVYAELNGINQSEQYLICSKWAADVNCDGNIRTSDGRKIAQYVDNPSQYTLECCSDTICGDVNCDGAVDEDDSTLLFDYIVHGAEQYLICSKWAADVNCDGNIRTSDGRKIAQYVDNPSQYTLECCSDTICGDVNCDGAVDEDDSTLLFNYFTHGIDTEEKAQKMTELDQKINAQDLNVEKSMGFFGTLGTFLVPGTQDLETDQVGILPDSKLYFFKEISRKVKMAFTFNPIKKVELQQRFADEKLIETKKVYEKNQDPEQTEKLLKEYSEEVELTAERIEKIKKSPKNQNSIDNLLDNLTDHLIKREKVVQDIQEKLKKQLPFQVYEKVEANLDRAVGKLGVKIEQLEENGDLLKERFIKIAAKQKGSEFKDFKNLEILKEIEEKMPSETNEAIKKAREEINEKFIQNISKMDIEKRMNFKNYVNEIDGNSIRHLEIIKEIESKEISPEVRVEIEKAKERTIERIEKEMKEMKSKHQRENFLEVLENPEIEKLRVINELEDKLPSEFLNEIKKVKEKNIHSIREKIKNNSQEQKKFVEKAKQYHDVSQFEILEEIGMNVNGKIKQVIDKAVDRTYEEFENDIKRVEGEENKRMILEKLTTDQPNHIEVLNRVQKKMEIRQLEGKFPFQSAAPETLNRVINTQTEKINSRIENMDDQAKVEKIQEQIQNSDGIRKEMIKRILDFERKIEERKNFIKERSSILEKISPEKTCKDLCGDGICQEIVCMAGGCPCAETTRSCPEDCKKNLNCAREGEMIGRNGCCEGLTAKEAAKVNFAGECYHMRHLICLSCGDGECDFNENECNCPEDCKENSECAKAGEQVNRNPLMGPTDKQCCAGLVENRVSKSYSICEKATEQTCNEKCKSLGYVSGECRKFAISPEGMQNKCRNSEVSISGASDCTLSITNGEIDEMVVGIGITCCCQKRNQEINLQTY